MYAAQASFVAGARNSKDGREGYRSGDYITICAQLSYPLSRGNVHIRSASTMDNPTVDPQFFNHPMDLEILVARQHNLTCQQVINGKFSTVGDLNELCSTATSSRASPNA